MFNKPHGAMGKRLRPGVALAAAALWLAGCAGPAVEKSATFFPPPPNLPRVQFLAGINNSQDVEGVKSAFSLFGSLGEEETERIRPILKPYGIAQHEGKLYVCDAAAARVIVIDLPNRKFAYLKGAAGLGKLTKPVNLAVDRQGFVYVADTGRNEVLVYSPEGEFLQAFGKDNAIKPVDVAVFEETLYVLDLKNSEIKLLDRKSGKLQGAIGKSDKPEERLFLPTNLTIDDKGFIYVSSAGDGRISKLDRDGHLIQSFGKLGDGFGEFARPRGVAVDKNGRIYVVDAGHQNVQIFNEEGKILMFFGDPGLPQGSLNLPAGILVTGSNLDYFQKLADPTFKLEEVLLVTSQYGTGSAMISIYGLGKKEGIDYEKEYERLRQEREKRAREAREKQEQEEKEKKGVK